MPEPTPIYDGMQRDPAPPRCVAHGVDRCPRCSRTQTGGLTARGECTDCGVYGETGMHWDTCANRVR